MIRSVRYVSRRSFLAACFLGGRTGDRRAAARRSGLRSRPPLPAMRRAGSPAYIWASKPNGDVKIVAHRSEMGTGCAHVSADDRGRRTRSRLESRHHPAGLRRCEVRLAEHRWIVFGARLLRCDAVSRRRRAHDAGTGGCRQSGACRRRSAAGRSISSCMPRAGASWRTANWCRWQLRPRPRSRTPCASKRPRSSATSARTCRLRI